MPPSPLRVRAGRQQDGFGNKPTEMNELPRQNPAYTPAMTFLKLIVIFKLTI